MTSNRRLRFLVVMPRLVQNVGDGYSFPLGLPYISGAMKRAGFEVHALNLNHRQGDVPDILQAEIAEKEIDVVATGGLSFQYTTVREVVETAKGARPGVRTIVGGGIMTADPEATMEALEHVDYGVLGEGEITIAALCEALEQGQDVAGIQGLIYKADDGLRRTDPRAEVKDVDTLPWPDYEGFELDTYLQASPSISGLNRQNTVFMITSRSCPFQCTFCFHTTGRKYRQRSLDGFFEELDHMVATYDIDYVCIADELFSVNPKRVKEFCRRIKQYGIKWWAQFRCDHIVKNPELLEVLKGSGCEVMSFGLESADNRILESMRKKTTIEMAEQALKLVYDANIAMEGAFLFGDIEETRETANNTLQWWKDHAEYRIVLNVVTIYPGTFLYENAIERGLIKDRVAFLRNSCPQVNVSKLDDGEYAVMLREIMEAPFKYTRQLSDVTARVVDFDTGRMEIEARCTACDGMNSWNDTRAFSASWLACSHCNQKYNLVLPDEAVQTIDANVRQLLRARCRLAVWGVNYHVANLFQRSPALRGARVYPIDISEGKRKMDLYGRKVHPPEIIEMEGIDAVIVAVPPYINEIRIRINKNHPGVTEVIDVRELLDPQYSASPAEDGDELTGAIRCLERHVEDPGVGLPEDVFLLLSRLTPMVNVDLLIKDERGRTLLSWRKDPFFQEGGWHVPGGIIRHKERMEQRIREVARTEIGAEVELEPGPLAINQPMRDHDTRGHFVSILFRCTLPADFVPENRGLSEGDNGYLRWHDNCPGDLIPVHDMYRKHI